MARKSKYEISGASAPRVFRWNAALYLRLSREDGDKDESYSIANQREMLQNYISTFSDIEVFDTYIDDGFSGTTFNRPDFQRMMDDVKAKSINCVVVKDLSRFGRNYIEVGNFIEQVFPVLDVRFISINDNLDSHLDPQSLNNLIVPFKNIINDEYCRDISNKIRSSLDLKRKQGKFIGSFAAYGYKKDPNDRNKLIIDEYPASVIRDIYRWFLQGSGIITISKRLNEQGILNPTSYKKSLGMNYRHPTGAKNDSLWCDSSVRRILTNPIMTGILVQGKNKIKSYKLQVAVAQPKENWFVCQNTHEAIIDRETFDRVQELLSRDTRTPPKRKELYLFSGFLRCADCKKAMNRKVISQPYATYSYFICSTFKKMAKGKCTKHTIRSDKLEKAVFTTIQQQIQLAVSMDEIIKEIKERGQVNAKSHRFAQTLAAKEAEVKRMEAQKLELYSDWKNGDITKDEYTTLRLRYDEKIDKLASIIANVKKAMGEIENGVDHDNAFLSNYSKYEGIETLTREVIVELVDYIYVHEGGEITIDLKYADEYQSALEYIKLNYERDIPMKRAESI